MPARAAPPPSAAWRFAVDRGGTFTDVLGIAPDGAVHAAKLLSVSPAYADAVTEGVRRLLKLPAGAPLPAARIAGLHVGTTVATNALLERRGARVALLVTRGFADLLAIGPQARPELFALAVRKPEQLYATVAEVDERTGADGQVLRALDVAHLRRTLGALRRAGYRDLAVLLLHAWANPAHERRVGELAAAAGFTRVTLSHRVSNRIKATARGQAAVVDAYLTPGLGAYVDALAAGLPGVAVSLMQSGGGLKPAGATSGREAVLSGPAGGVVAVAALARELRAPVIGLDMGGTSTDVCRSDGGYERVEETHVGGIAFHTPMLRVETVAAGGGSVLGVAGDRLTVGPHSAGADPGPACYGHGGPATLTDANLLLGRLVPSAFPREFGPHRDAGLDRAAAASALRALAAQLPRGAPRSLEALALGFVAVANAQIAAPIKALSVARGHDVRTHALAAFGGAGGLHACALARELGIRRVVVHPLAGLYSAFGIALAERTEQAERAWLKPLAAAGWREVEAALAALEAAAVARLGPGPAHVERVLELRPAGAEGTLAVPATDAADVRRRFRALFLARHGYAPAGPLEIAALRVSVRRPAPQRLSPAPQRLSPAPQRRPRRALAGHRRVVFADGAARVPVYRREALARGTALASPCLIAAAHYTVLVEADFAARVDARDLLVLERRSRPALPAARRSRRADPALLELYNHRLRGIAEQMGAALVATAHSVNMKERLDFSCALFDGAGELAANAPHIPVHLGAMGESVRSLIAARGAALRRGQVYLTNHPAHGGSHLPDLTAVTPVFLPRGRRAAFFVATRGHHADLGGPVPGSMSPFARTLAEEGVVFDHFLAVSGGRLHEATLRAHLAAGLHPARSPHERIADLRAMLAANRLGERALLALCRDHGAAEVAAYMRHLRASAAAAVRAALVQLLAGRPVLEARFADALDDRTPIAVRVRLEAGPDPPRSARLELDFSASGPRHRGSFNAPRAVTRAAVLYVLRCLTPADIPLNEGCLAPVTLRLAPGSLLDPPPDAAVVAGNVETAQRVVDVLLGALRVAAASQGTMNNLLLGFEAPVAAQYYETIGGGSGATAGADGASAVQVHMTNTRATDPEILEQRLPGLRLCRFAIRRGSGGAGAWRGGDGIVRELELLAPARLTLLTQRRLKAPFGLAGGAPGRPGRNRLRRGGRTRRLPPVGVWELKPGDVLTVETPGGGGYGKRQHP